MNINNVANRNKIIKMLLFVPQNTIKEKIHLYTLLILIKYYK